MISHEDIKNLVSEWGLREDIIEKDYVIGWILWGIGSDPDVGPKWAFKGGTCTKKCFIETLILHAIKTETQEHRTFRVNWIQNVKISTKSFTPKYQIEFSPIGPIEVLPRKT